MRVTPMLLLCCVMPPSRFMASAMMLMMLISPLPRVTAAAASACRDDFTPLICRRFTRAVRVAAFAYAAVFVMRYGACAFTIAIRGASHHASHAADAASGVALPPFRLPDICAVTIC